MQYTLQPDVQAETAEFYGAAAATLRPVRSLRKYLGASRFNCGDAVDTVRYGVLRQRAVPERSVEDCGARRSRRRTTPCGNRSGSEIRGGIVTDGVGGACRGRAPPRFAERMSRDRRSRRGFAAPRPRAGATRPPLPHPRTKLGLTLGIPLLWMVVDLPRRARALVCERVLARRHPDGQDRARLEPQELRHALEFALSIASITLRTVGIAAAVHVADIVLAFPLAYYAARMRLRPGPRALLVAVVMPLWSSYLVRAFAWKPITAPKGVADAMLGVVGIPERSSRQLATGRCGSRSATCGCRS